MYNRSDASDRGHIRSPQLFAPTIQRRDAGEREHRKATVQELNPCQIARCTGVRSP